MVCMDGTEVLATAIPRELTGLPAVTSSSLSQHTACHIAEYLVYKEGWVPAPRWMAWTRSFMVFPNSTGKLLE